MRLRKCCAYTLAETCRRCGAKAARAGPPRFTERYGKYRRLAKRQKL